MERKVKIGWDAIMILGVVFSCLGAIFLVAGCALGFFLNGNEAFAFLCAFGGMGVIYLVLGIVFLCVKIRKRRICNRLLQSGVYVTAEFTGSTMQYDVSVIGRHPYVAECQYQDGMGNIHIFKSRYLYFDPDPLLRGRNVKVYVEGENYKHYYVDIDEVLPNVIRH